MAMPKSALEGIRVIDLGRYQAGPRIGLVLVRLGAEVIKVEAPGGDESRRMGPLPSFLSSAFLSIRSMTSPRRRTSPSCTSVNSS
jgi:crotonobetainyl-CoA:carnitine CoA-transferase CaiB-like acyl-CoA transferase